MNGYKELKVYERSYKAAKAVNGYEGIAKMLNSFIQTIKSKI